jgi:hypothetical protein
MAGCSIDWRIVLSFLGLFLSWPAVTLYIFAVLVWLFREQIANLIRNFRGGKVGGVEVNFGGGQTDQSNAPPPEAMTQQNLFRALTCERLLNLIYGTQYDFLRLLQSRPEGATAAERDSFFTTHQERFPQTRYTPNDWSGWLLQVDLIRIVGGGDNTRFLLSELGHEFLRYVRDSYPTGIVPRFA